MLRGEERVMLIESVSEREETSSATQQALEEELLNQLKARRLQLARDENVPAYVIFSDANATRTGYLPSFTRRKIYRVSVVLAKWKIGKYGAAFLKVIRRYAEMHGQESRMENARRARRRTTRSASRVSDTKQASYDLFEEGKTVEEVAQARGFTTNTIYGHLMPYVADGKIGKRSNS